MKQALVAGGAGFIGRHLVEQLLKEGYKVFVIDNLSTGSKANLDSITTDGEVVFVEGDITSPMMSAHYRDEPFDLIVNLACPASPVHYKRLSLETLECGSTGVKQLLDMARLRRARFIHASTSEVYGDPSVSPQSESYYGNVNPYGVRSCYDESKRFSEALIYAHRERYGTNTGIVRIFNTYGPYMAENDGRVVSNFITQALKGEPLTIYGDGSQTRSFCYVDDLIDGLMLMVNSDDEGPVNLGNPEEFAVRDLAYRVEKMIDDLGTPVTQPVSFLPLTADDPLQRKPDITEARAMGFEPKVGLEEGLKRTIEYFKSTLHESAPDKLC